MKHTTNILEELLESEYKGLIYIDEQNRIGSYSKRAKEITGIISEDGDAMPQAFTTIKKSSRSINTSRAIAQMGSLN